MPETIHGLLRELDRSGCRPIVVPGYPRSGTHLLIDTLRLNFPRCASWKRPLERPDHLYLDLDRRAAVSNLLPELVRDILTRVERPLIKTHAFPDFRTELVKEPLRLEPELIDWLRGNATFLYVYRDGRESICAAHAALVCTGRDPSLGELMREQVHGMSRVRLWAHHVHSWLEDSRVYAIARAELFRQRSAVFPHIAEKLGFSWRYGTTPVLPPVCGGGILRRLHRRLARRPLSTATRPADKAHATDWRQAFTAADREFFHQEAGQMLIKLGYEDSDLWTDPRHDGDPRCPALFALQPVRSPAPALALRSQSHLASLVLAP